MKVSVLIPFHNGIEFLCDCIESLKNQTYKDFEVVVVLDHIEKRMGTEKASEVRKLLELSGLNINVCELDLGTGVAAARNEALLQARAEYVLFLDSDDYLDPDFLANAVPVAEKKGYAEGCFIDTWYGYEFFTKCREEGDEDGLSSDAKHVVYRPRIERDISVLGILYPRKMLEELGIRFNERYKYYSDMSFAVTMREELKPQEMGAARYFKRRHNDTITYPQLSEMVDGKRMREFLDSYYELIKKVNNKKYSDEILVRYLMRAFFCGNGETGAKWPAGVKAEFGEALKGVNIKSFAGMCYEGLVPAHDKLLKKYAEKRENSKKKEQLVIGVKELSFLRKLRAGKIKSASRKAKIAVMWRRRKGGVAGKQQRGRLLTKLFFRKMSVKNNWVIFESFLGKNYADSPKYIYEYMQATYGDKYKYIWFVDGDNAKISGKAEKVQLYSPKYFYYVSRAKYWVNNMRQPAWIEKRPGQIFLETWHGTPLKRLVFDMEEVHSASPNYKMTFYKQSRIWDYLISDNSFSTEVFQSAFKFPKEKILELGYPRNDILYTPDRDARVKEIKQTLGIPLDKKVILYAPTWRDDEYYEPGKYKFRLPLDLAMLKERLSDEYVLLLRTHYFIADNMEIREDEKDFVFDASRYNDVGHLYLISDICITDYSSVFFDYANLKRPILFYVYDFEKYRDELRGFYIDMETELPGPLLYTNDEVVNAIERIDDIEQEYKAKYDEFHKRFCSLDDGHAAERIVKKVFERVK